MLNLFTNQRNLQEREMFIKAFLLFNVLAVLLRKYFNYVWQKIRHRKLLLETVHNRFIFLKGRVLDVTRFVKSFNWFQIEMKKNRETLFISVLKNIRNFVGKYWINSKNQSSLYWSQCPGSSLHWTILTIAIAYQSATLK